ncbi:MAG: hypothetical protein ACYTAS_06425 [Planctomycetota bacterium]|jgi:hypothetical protein
MSILAVNLRQLYQRRGLWLAYLLFGFMALASVGGRLDFGAAGAGEFVGLIALAFLVGMCAAVLQMEIMSKPLAYCLPGHRLTVRKFIFAIGVATNLASGVLFLFYPGLSFGWRLAAWCSAFFAGLVFYLAGAALALRYKGGIACFCILLLTVAGGPFLKVRILLEGAVVGHPVWVVGFGLAFAAGAWVLLGEAELARRHCLRRWIGFGEGFDWEKMRRSQRNREAAPWAKLKDHPRPWVEGFFMGRMSRCGSNSVERFVWGALYGAYGLMMSQWKSVAALALFMVVFVGYLGPRLWIMLALVPITALETYVSQPAVYSTMPTPGGRDERFGSTLATAMVGACLLTLFIGAVAIASAALAVVLPDLSIYGLMVEYRAIGIGAFYLPLVFLPLALSVQLAVYPRRALMTFLLVILAFLAVRVGEDWRFELAAGSGAAGWAASAAVCWLAFVLVLRYIAAKRCLVR